MEDLLQVGVITTTHGVRGEVKVFPTTDDPARFKKLKNVVLDTGKELVDLEVAGVKFFKNMVIVKFKGIDNINDVEKYRKKSLYVTRENAVKLKKNEYFIADLIGLQAESDEGEDLGELSDVLQTGANDVYVLSKEGTDDILLPAIKECVKEVDLENGKINIDHQLQRKRNMEYIIEATKTDSGTRMVPMTEEVQECFRFIITNRKKPKKEPVIYDKNRVSYKGFLYLDKNDMPMVALHWEKYFQHICEKYNKIYKEELPKITPHVCRHTFCSNMAKSGMNPKTLQKIMGHSDIGVTLNTYTHLDFEDIQKEMKQVCDSEL